MELLGELQGLMIRYRFVPKRKASQHFVVNNALVQKLVSLALLEAGDVALEIGAGTGFLTRELLKKCRVVAFEIDESLCGLLSRELPPEKLALVCGDFLKQDIPKFTKVVSLPPYSESSAIVHKLLGHDFELAVFVFQREFAEKLVALPGFGNYSALTVLVQQRFDCRIVERISPSCFFPRPKGESAIVVLRARDKEPKVRNQAIFRFFVKTIFRFRNKNLRNALQKARQFLLPKLKMERKEFDAKVEKLPFLEEKVKLLSVESIAEAFNQIAAKARSPGKSKK